jgi:hypothetical protein
MAEQTSNDIIADIRDFKFDLTLSKALERTKEAIEKTTSRLGEYEETKNELTNELIIATISLDHYTKVANDDMSINYADLFELDKKTEELSRRFARRYSPEERGVAQREARILHFNYLKNKLQ